MTYDGENAKSLKWTKNAWFFGSSSQNWLEKVEDVWWLFLQSLEQNFVVSPMTYDLWGLPTFSKLKHVVQNVH